jgi:signal peptidase II
VTEAVETSQMEDPFEQERTRRVLPRILFVAFVVLVLDLGTKALISRSMELHDTIEVVPGFFNLHYIKNSGAAFGIGTRWPQWLRLPFFVGVFLLASWVLYSFYKRCTPQQKWLSLSLGLVGGGALGNMYDRIVYQRVTDFLSLHVGDWYWPNFNVADMAITVGVAILFLEVWFLEGRRPAAASSE